MDIEKWLCGLGLQQYVTTFRDNAIDAEVLSELTEADLEKLGVVLGHRKRLLKAIATLTSLATLEHPTPVGQAPSLGDGAERRHLTVMFCDLVGSTALASRLDPEDMREVIGAYHRCVAKTVARFDGFVAKYMGDGVLVYFGYPHAHEDDAERCVRAGLEIVAELNALKAPLPLQARVGIATGLVVVGDLIGKGSAQEQAIVGETPNLAARLQNIAEPNTVYLAEGTRRLLGKLFDLEDCGLQHLKGIGPPARAWKVLRTSSVQSRFDAHHASRLTQLVGREEELELVLRRWSRCEEGCGHVVLLSGEAGIGKSRLTVAAIESLAGVDHFELRYFCSLQHSGSSLYPVISHLERQAGISSDDSGEAKLQKLKQLLTLTATPAEEVALLAELLSIPVGLGEIDPTLTAQQKRNRTLNALAKRILALGAVKPTLVILEDAHWIDPTSLELLNRLIEEVRTSRVMIVVTFRPEFSAPWVEDSHVTSLTLNPLQRREAEAMVAALAGKTGLSSDMLSEIVEQTDGIPLFLEEMTKALLEAENAEAIKELTSRSLAPSLGVPASLQAPLMARVDRLGPAKPVVQIASALGREFSYELLAAVANHLPGSLLMALDQLVKAGLLFRSGDGQEPRFLFKHALIQDAAYGTLLRQTRRDLHQRISAALIDRFPDIAETQPEILAHHCYEAGLVDQAVQWRIKAGQRALRRSAFKEAARQFSSGLSNTEAAPEQVDLRYVVELHTGLGTALTATNGYASKEAGEAFTRARVLCEKLNDTKALARVGYGQYLYHMMAGQVLKSEELAREILALGERLADPRLRLLGLRTLGVSLFELGHLAEAQDSLDRAMSLLVAQTGNDVTKAGEAPVMIWSWLCHVFLYQGHFDRARAVSELAIKEARRSRSAHTQASSMGFGAALSFETLEADFADRGQALLELAHEQDLDLHRGIGAMYVALDAMRRGEPSAPAAYQEALGRYLETGAQWALPALLSFFSGCLPDDHPEKAVTIERGFEAVETMQERWGLPELFRQKGDVERARRDKARAEQNYFEAIRVANEQGSMLHKLRASSSLAKLWQGDGRAEAAHEMLAPVLQWFAEKPEVPLISEARHLLASLSAAR